MTGAIQHIGHDPEEFERAARVRGFPGGDSSFQNIERNLKLEMKSFGKMGSRTRGDIEAGRLVLHAQLKEKKRNRAAEHRKSRGAVRAQGRIQKEKDWHCAFDDPGQRPRATDWVDQAKTYKGIEDDIEPEPDIERRSLNKLVTATFLTEPPQAGTSACEAPLQSSWSKPAYEKNKGVDQKIRQRDMRREKRRLKRESEKHCVSYTKHGLCKLGGSCRFRHGSGIKHEDGHQDMVMCSLHNVEGAAHPHSKGQAYERAGLIMDSGASTSTVPSSIANGFNMQQRPGKVYYSASGHQVAEKGSKVVKCAFQNGEREDLRFKAMDPDVRRGLVSVSVCVKAGNKVAFDRPFIRVQLQERQLQENLFRRRGPCVACPG